MSIDEIRAEVPKAFGPSFPGRCKWIREHGKPDFDEKSCYGFETNQTAAQILVDRAYEAGVKRGGEISMSALNEVELRENPIYQKGYEAGKLETPECLECKSGDYKKGYDKAAKDPEAWYVLDKNGEKLHLNDRIETSDGTMTITRIHGDIEPMECTVIACDEEFGFEYKPWKVEKVTHDSWEQWQGDLIERLHHARKEAPEPSDDYWDYFEDIAEEFSNRAKKLSKDNDELLHAVVKHLTERDMTEALKRLAEVDA